MIRISGDRSLLITERIISWQTVLASAWSIRLASITSAVGSSGYFSISPIMAIA
jgi:hypothetical protein